MKEKKEWYLLKVVTDLEHPVEVTVSKDKLITKSQALTVIHGDLED